MMNRKMIKKSVFAATMAMAIFGMAGTASAEYWYCQSVGTDFSDPDNNKGAQYVTGVFYSGEKVYTSDFSVSIHGKFLPDQASCLSYNTKREAEHSRNDTINESERNNVEVRYSRFDN